MTPPEPHPPLQRRVAAWQASAGRGARALACAGAAALATAAGVLTLPPSLWSAIALSCGVALAAALRYGAGAAVVAVAATASMTLALGIPPGPAAALALAQAVFVAVAWRLLVRRPLTPRLERANELLRWALASAAAAAPLAAGVGAVALLASRLPATGAWAAVGSDFVVAWTSLALGSLLASFPLLSIERAALLRTLQSAGRLLAASALLLALLGGAALLSLPQTHASAVGRPIAFAMPLLLLALAAAGGTPLAGLGALVAVLLAFGSQGAWGPGPAGLLAFASWSAVLLATLLVAHARNQETHWRLRRWEWALDGSRLGVADWPLRHGPGFASGGWRALTGHASETWTPDDWLDGTHPEDRELLEAAIAAVSAGGEGRRRAELRMRQPGEPGDRWRWFEATLLVIERDPAGQPARLLATLADVDERHEALERQRLSASLFQHLHEGLLVTDADLRVLDVNPAYGQILGLQRHEVLGQVPSLLRPTPADPIARQQRAAMWASLRDTGRWRGELLERRRSGEACTLSATISSVLGPQGDLRYHVLVISDITEQRAQRERLERQAHFDELTRLPNRARLAALLAEAMAATDRDGTLLAVCYLDLDRFKPVNDRFGHAAGDRLLAELAGRLRSRLRSRDSWADVAARLGGDEFVLLLRVGTYEEARQAVDRVLGLVAKPYVIDPAVEPVQITASLGATIYPIDRSDADTLLRHADHAMYDAKQSGRNTYLFFDPEHRRRTEERSMMIGRVQEALDRGELVLFYQPKVDMRAGRVLGLEALLRWEHPQQGLIAPQRFLPLIEDSGLSARVGDWVFGQALDHLAAWRRAGLDISVSVNVSARHLQEPGFAQTLAALLAQHPEPLAAHVELEMVETAAFADIEATSALMARCRELGVRFALDDFGTGYSPLTYLKQLPADTLKIDRGFVHNMLGDTQDRALVEGVISLARTFGCAVVAEGVESPAQARTLLELGCDVGQGTGIAAPMPAAEVAGWVRGWRGMFALAPAGIGEADGGAAAGLR